MKRAIPVRRSLILGPLAVALAVAVIGVVHAAQDTQPADPAPDALGAAHAGHAATPDGHANLVGMHAMPATVNSVERLTGVVGVTAGGMDLKVHFPPAVVATLRAGDAITLHMGYSKP